MREKGRRKRGDKNTHSGPGWGWGKRCVACLWHAQVVLRGWCVGPCVWGESRCVVWVWCV